MKKNKPAKAEDDAGRSFLVFGLDEKGKPHAARFPASQKALAKKAAEAMQLHFGDAPDQLGDVAQKLPIGRLYANGKGFVPPVRRELFARLAAAFNVQNPDTGMPLYRTTAAGLPKTFDEIEVGKVVLAHLSFTDGWWEFIVTHREGDLLTLRYRDYPNEETLVRNIASVALINPAAALD